MTPSPGGQQDPLAGALPALRRTVAQGMLALGGLSLLCSVAVLSVPVFNMELFDRVLTTRNHRTLWSLAEGLLICLLTYAALSQLRHRALAVLSERLVATLSLPLLEVTAGAAGGPAAGLQALCDLETLRGFLASPACLAPFDLAWTPLLLGVFLLLHWGYAALALGCTLVLCGLNLLGDAVTRRQMLAASDAAADGIRVMAGAVRGAEAVLAMGLLPAVARRWDAAQRDTLDASHRAMLRARLIAALTRAGRMAMTAAMVALGLVLALSGQASSGSMVAGNMILARLLGPFEQIAGTRRAWIDAFAAWRRVRAALREAVPARYIGPLPCPDGRLVAERLVHVPHGADRPALRGVSFAVAPGEVLGIIGPAGAGKSTLLRLLLGMEQPTAGGVFLDGHGTHLWQREDFARHVGFVPQSVALVDGTVAENIARLQRPDPLRLLEAARAAGVHAVVAALPQGYSTRITASGPLLSAGQRQRVALARALYGRPRLLVLDEPDAFLDAEGERMLLDLLYRLKREGVGAIVATHRPSLVAAADTLLVLRDGLVERHGPRAAVLAALATPLGTARQGSGSPDAAPEAIAPPGTRPGGIAAQVRLLRAPLAAVP